MFQGSFLNQTSQRSCKFPSRTVQGSVSDPWLSTDGQARKNRNKHRPCHLAFTLKILVAILLVTRRIGNLRQTTDGTCTKHLRTGRFTDIQPVNKRVHGDWILGTFLVSWLYVTLTSRWQFERKINLIEIYVSTNYSELNTGFNMMLVIVGWDYLEHFHDFKVCKFYGVVPAITL